MSRKGVITIHGSPSRVINLWKNRFAAFAFRRVCTSNIEHVSIRVNRAPQPMFLATDCDHDFVKMPLIVRLGSIPANAVCKMLPKAIDPWPDRLTAGNHIARANRSSTSAVLSAKRWYAQTA